MNDNDNNNNNNNNEESPKENLSEAAKRALARRARIKQSGNDRMNVITASLTPPTENEEKEEKKEEEKELIEEEKPKLTEAQLRAQRRREKIKQNANDRLNIIYSVHGIEPPEKNVPNKSEDDHNHILSENIVEKPIQSHKIEKKNDIIKKYEKCDEDDPTLEEEMQNLVNSLSQASNNPPQNNFNNNNNNNFNNFNNFNMNNFMNIPKSNEGPIKHAKKDRQITPISSPKSEYIKSISSPIITMIFAIFYTLSLSNYQSNVDSIDQPLNNLYLFLHSINFPSLILPTLFLAHFSIVFATSFLFQKKKANTSSASPFSFMLNFLANDQSESMPLINFFVNTILPLYSSFSLFRGLLKNLRNCLFVFVFTIVVTSSLLSI